MLVTHNSPNKSARKIYSRQQKIANDFSWQGKVFQTRTVDLININGRVSKILSQKSLGITPVNVEWKAADNTFFTFTPDEFLAFAIKVADHIEDKYIESWT